MADCDAGKATEAASYLKICAAMNLAETRRVLINALQPGWL